MALTRTAEAANPGFAGRHNLSPHRDFCSATLAHTARLAKLYAVSECRLFRVHGLQVTVLPRAFTPATGRHWQPDAAKPGDFGADVRRDGRAVSTIGRQPWCRACRLRNDRERGARRGPCRGAAADRRGAASIPTWCNWQDAKRAGWERPRASPRHPAPAIIDINMGCPARHVTGANRAPR